MADVTFYSSVRRGAALAITRDDFTVAPTDPVARAHAQLSVKLAYDATHTASTKLPLVGPGDIVGLDARSIVRTFPRADDNDAEGGFLCYVEFDQVDLPWRYTPARVAGDAGARTDRIRPWLFLLVLVDGTELGNGDFRPPQGAEKLPQLIVRDPSLLPNLDEAWAWAHVQGQEALTDAAMAAALAGNPGAVVARLLAPRQLEDSTAYRAFLVPTFLRGVLAGQGTDPADTDGLAPAWSTPAATPVTLPVYHSWRFQTGTVSSFDEAVRQLKPAAALPPTVGLRSMDVSSPGFALPSPTGGTDPLFVGGALQTPEQATAPDPTLADDWVRGLGAFADLGVQTVGNQQLRVVSPPLYGRWYAAENHLDVPGQTGAPSNPPWFASLNKDPRHRVAAGLGTEAVQRNQQALMAAARDQAARLDTVNRTRRVMQTGREVFTRLMNRHLSTGPVGSVFLVTAFLHNKVLSCTSTASPRPTIGGIMPGTPFHNRPLPWRRTFHADPTIIIETINRGGFFPLPATPPNMSTPATGVGTDVPGGVGDPGIGTIISTMNPDQRLYWGVVIFWVARRLLSTEGGKYWWLLRRLLRLGLDLIALAGTQGVVGVTVLEKLRAGTLQGPDIQSLPSANNFTSVTRDPNLFDPTTWPTARTLQTGADSTEAGAFRTAAAALFNYINGAPLPGPVFTRADVPTLVSCILTTLAPAVTFVLAERARNVPARIIAWQAPDQLEPILLAPRVGLPMWQSLRDISVDWILPGVGDLPRNSVSLVETNQKFIESFMVGLNHQMTRELLWNGYPTDQRGTYFQQFWDFRGWVKGTSSEPDRTDATFADITPVAGWDHASALGTHTGRLPATEHLVLVVRGDVIKRYPNVVVYASKAVDLGHGVLTLDDGNQKHPVFQAILTADIAFYGFELTAGDARGTPGGDPGWFFVLQEHPSEPKFNRSSSTEANAHPGNYSAAVAADVANTAYETPLRVAIHGTDLLPPPA